MTWTPIKGEHAWQAEGRGGRRYQISKPKRGRTQYELTGPGATSWHDSREAAEVAAEQQEESSE
jgi:hypothetical protein